MTDLLRALLFAVALLFAPFALANPIDLNTASVSELDSLPGIGPAKASAIAEYRAANGPFVSVDQLDDVPGIGPATLDGLRDMVMVGAADGGTTPAAAPAPAAAPVAASTPSGGGVNINAASEAQLRTLSGIGATKAAAIVEDRNLNGPFSSCADLARVNGIGPATVSAIGDSCTVQ